MSGANGNGRQIAVIKPRDYRHDCGRLLFRGILTAGSLVEIRCPRCGRMAIFPPPHIEMETIEKPELAQANL